MNTLPERTTAEPALLIFDCDGVLVDSEILVCTAVAEELTKLGYPITPEDVVRRFAGRPEREILAEVKEDWGQPVPEAYFVHTKQRINAAFSTELQAIAGVAEMLAQLRLPRIVASSSAPAKLEQGLRFVGLYDLLAPHIVSTQMVRHGKPAPDVFVFAAGWMRVPVNQCLVIEDSEPGVRAARAAGMRVVGFTGGSHCGADHGERLLAAGAERVLRHMGELASAVPSAFGAAVSH
ncbi:HAD family phosphatase [Acidipila sp. EB88]|uniref:HAD family hydrolase n=1 Tax=Acidipila sp. EB88 TaxID=2305226 RepID=UPI000F5E0841|nr:HAD family hydrolase [Acidipila sp. EB88]RRA49018.1 HAD family hydrolase [Acidipila sp. EB88]